MAEEVEAKEEEETEKEEEEEEEDEVPCGRITLVNPERVRRAAS